MNLIFWANESSAAVPFSTLIALLALWFGVSLPLTFIGAYFGFRKRVIFFLQNLSLLKKGNVKSFFFFQNIFHLVYILYNCFIYNKNIFHRKINNFISVFRASCKN